MKGAPSSAKIFKIGSKMEVEKISIYLTRSLAAVESLPSLIVVMKAAVTSEICSLICSKGA
jgi:hypothetical protein